MKHINYFFIFLFQITIPKYLVYDHLEPDKTEIENSFWLTFQISKRGLLVIITWLASLFEEELSRYHHNQILVRRSISTMASSSSTRGDHEGTATTPNWLELPRDVTAKILEKVGAFGMIRSAERVCSLWRNICMDPLMWRTVDMRRHNPCISEVRRAVDRSCGHLEEIHLQYFISEGILCDIADR